MSRLHRWLRNFLPGRVRVNQAERLRSAAGALLGILLTGALTRATLGARSDLPLLIAPMGASAVLLFAVPSSPLAQPWSLIGGNLVSAIIGVLCAQWITDPFTAAACAVAFAIALMFALRCLHPPSGAVALTAVLGGGTVRALGFHFVLIPVLLNSALLLAAAIAFNNLTRRRYPHASQVDHRTGHHTSDPRPTDRIGFTPADLEEVLKQYNQVLDVAEDDLETLFLQAEMRAYQRRYGEISCADIMSRDVVTAQADMPLAAAWKLLRRHHVKALPVVDKQRRVVGIVTLRDFVRHAGIVGGFDPLDSQLREWLRRSLGKPRRVRSIMATSVRTVGIDTHIAHLVPLLCDLGFHHVPVLDKEQRLAGMVTQSDVIAALYRGKLTEAGNDAQARLAA